MEGIVEKIAKELIDVHGNISTQELAERLGVSVSSIKHNLTSVRGLLREQGVNLLSIPQKGLCIDATEEQRDEIDNMLQRFANHNPISEEFRRDYIFHTVFQYQGSYTINLLAEELYVSRNLISKDLRALNEFLEMFHVRIEAKKNKGIVVSGHEFEIRQALILYNNQKWWKEVYLDTPKELDVRLSKRAWTFLSNFYPECFEDIWDIQEALHEMEKQIGILFTDVSFGRIMEYLMITRERIKQKKYIRSHIQKEHLPLGEKYLEAAEIFLSMYMNRNNSCWEFERLYLAARLYEAGTMNPIEKIGGFQDAVKQYLEKVKNAVGRYYSVNDSELLDNVEDLITRIRYREDYCIYDWTDLAKDVKERFSGLYAVCLMQIYILEDAVGIMFREDDIAAIVLLVHNHMRKRRKEAIFVTAANEEESYYNLIKLKNQFPYLHFREVINFNKFRMKDYERALVISTVELKESVPNLICITKHVDDKDFQLIRQRLGTKEVTRARILERVFNEELVWDISAKSKEDALEQIVGRMKELGYVEDGFLDEIMDRERFLATSVGNQIAIPHVYLKHVIRTGVAIVRLKNSVIWSKDERASLIFLFAVRDDNSEDIKRLFVHVYNILKQDELIEKIKNAKNKRQIVQFILNCEYDESH